MGQFQFWAEQQDRRALRRPKLPVGRVGRMRGALAAWQSVVVVEVLSSCGRGEGKACVF